MRAFSAVIERDPEAGLFVGHVPGFPGAHSQGASLDELNANLWQYCGRWVSSRFDSVGRTSGLAIVQEDRRLSHFIQAVTSHPR